MSVACPAQLLRSVVRAATRTASAAARNGPYSRAPLALALALPPPRMLSTSVPRSNSPPSADAAEKAQGLALEPKLQLTFTCTVPDCGTRSTHEFTRRSYQKGIVLVQCPGCKNRHLIADNLGWFKDSDEPRTVEQMVAANGGRIVRGTKVSDADSPDQGETIEITSDSHPDLPPSHIPAPKKS